MIYQVIEGNKKTFKGMDGGKLRWKKKRIKSFMRNKMRYLPEKVCKDKSINKCVLKINKPVDLEEKTQNCQKKRETADKFIVKATDKLTEENW